MFNKILIANRGEIACRVIKTANKLGVKTVAVYSDADRNALHVNMADEAIHIGGSASQESYLVSARIIEAAKLTGAQAIHPGYGFLSENAEFAELCDANDIVFIGPPTGAILSMGSKSAAKSIMSAADVPLVPGYHGEDQNPELLKKSADDMGYPVLLKAVAGGGGKGMRQVWSESEFAQALADAKRESMSSFANDDMLVEKYLTQPRHVEVQVFCDQHGNGVYLFERDCSVQRRHQKVIEEAPAPKLAEGLREQMGEAAVRAAQAIDYVGAGTVEFLLDTDGSYYFMEMNTRLQVEHPVTELITGQDLVEWQLRVADGEPLPLKQEQLQIHGHSFEARIYAEDADNDFMPATGTLHHLQPPAESKHVRVDTGVIEGDEVSPFYDPMIAKLIVWDEDRDRALARLCRALSEYQVSGLTTNIQFLYRLADSSAFRNADLDTGFIEKHHDEIFKSEDGDLTPVLPLAALFLLLKRQQSKLHTEDEHPSSPWNTANGWRLNQANIQSFDIVLGGENHRLLIEQLTQAGETVYANQVGEQNHIATAELNNKVLSVKLNGHQQQLAIASQTVASQNDIHTMFLPQSVIEFTEAEKDLGEDNQAAMASDFSAPMNGTIVAVLAGAGSSVAQGDSLLIMEAMKMQHTINAPADGTVVEVFCEEGDLVEGGTELLQFSAVEG